MKNTWIVIGAVSGFLAVAMGAFAAHALRARLSERALEIFEVGARYQMYHALALVGFGLWMARYPNSSSLPGWAFTVGTIIFCGSLYALAISDVKWLGAITPIGGLAFMVGWLAFGWAALSTSGNS